MKKIFALILCLAMTAAMLASCGDTSQPSDSGNPSGGEGGDGQVVWRLAHTEAKDTIYDSYANKFAELVEEKSGGRIHIDVYPVGALGDTATQMELLMNGGIEFGICAAGEVGDMFPAVQALSLNFVFSDDNSVNNKVLTQGEGTAYLSELFKTKGLTTYDWFSLGNMQWGGSRALRTVDDFKGFRMRIMASPILAANYEALGATPTPMAFTETYSGLQLKTVDGTEQPMNAMEEMKFYEVIDYITMSNHCQMASFMSMNSDFYNGLSDEDKAILEEIKPQMESFAEQTLEDFLASKTEVILTNKPDIEIVELTDAERQAFVDASLTVRDRIEEFGGEEGKTLLDLLLKDVEKFSK
ncbi:MAG: DctP family TRAP transporter solute-binding subunit [Oscillospiraceae bacterium]|nr:DctP family TRAP transporter solute-binding subunit [Oscillospiraceae bacterium]